MAVATMVMSRETRKMERTRAKTMKASLDLVGKSAVSIRSRESSWRRSCSRDAEWWDAFVASLERMIESGREEGSETGRASLLLVFEVWSSVFSGTARLSDAA